MPSLEFVFGTVFGGFFGVLAWWRLGDVETRVRQLEHELDIRRARRHVFEKKQPPSLVGIDRLRSDRYDVGG